MKPKRSLRKLLLSVGLAALFISCAGTPGVSAPVRPDAGDVSPASPLPDLTLYFPIETVTLAEAGRTGSLEDSLVVLRFDRPGAWSIYPERFLFKNGVPRRLVPIQLFGSSRLKSVDMILLRTVPERPAGFQEGNREKDFFEASYTHLPVPEAILLLDASYIEDPLAISLPKDSPQYKRGIQDRSTLPPDSQKQVSLLKPEARVILDDALRLGSAAGSRRGFRSLVLVPFDAVSLGTYTQGLELEFLFSFIPDRAGFENSFSVSVIPAGNLKREGNSGADKLDDVRVGDLGVFAGATPLLDPDMPRVAAEVYESRILTKIGQSKALRPSPVLWEGSFNAYRDERRKFLFSPGVFSYIPGKHPDISPRDVEKVTGMEQIRFDSLLKGRSVVSFQHSIYGAIPAFIAASSSPTELEIAFTENPHLRESLEEFLKCEARFIWLD
jgi:hypothetical protein